MRLPGSVAFAVGLAILSLTWAGELCAADKIVVTVANPSELARPAEVIAVGFEELRRRWPDLRFDHLLVKDAAGAVVPAQGTNYQPEEHHDNYLDLIFQHDFAAGEKRASFTIEKTVDTVPPFPTRVSARHVPERFDDFAWENDRVAHRAYGPGLDSAAAGASRMISSGIDLWCKRVRYPIVDRWYLKGHYHDDTGEGLDMYDVGKLRGAGGTGVWDGRSLSVAGNWKTWRVLANGPIRAVFELMYEPWDAADGVKITERKRYIVDAGHNLDLIESTFDLVPAPGSRGEVTIAVGLTRHPKQATATLAHNDKGAAWISVWEDFRKEGAGNLGTGVVLDPAARFAGFADLGDDRLILAKVGAATSLRFYAGGGWQQSGDFTSRAGWEAYLAAWSKRLASPIKVTLSPP
jgi:Domain of unknown function (DUF4861)